MIYPTELKRAPPTLTEAGKLFPESESRTRSTRSRMLRQIWEHETPDRCTEAIGAFRYRRMSIPVEAIPGFKEKYLRSEIRAGRGIPQGDPKRLRGLISGGF